MSQLIAPMKNISKKDFEKEYPNINIVQCKITMCEHQWISVKDRLPDNNTNVLCYSNADTLQPIREGIYINQFHCLHKFFDESVTHWMPLPEPPKD